jgi:hypothetical protein
MGQNPVNPSPSGPMNPQSGPSGPSAPSFGQPAAPGYGVPGPQPGATPYGSPSGAGPAGAGAYSPAPPQAYGRPAGMPPTGSAPKKKGNGLLIGLIAGGAALVLVIAAVVAIVLIQRATPASTAPDKATTSTAALKGYLGAVAAGDADKAKQYAMNPPADSPMLTNEFLAASVATNPITEILVNEKKDSGTTSYVSASYRIGGTLVQGNYQLTKVAKLWKLDSIVAAVDRPSYWGTFGVTINGTTAPTSKFALFPGVYQLGTGTSLLAFDKPAFTVEKPDDYISGFSSTKPSLTDAGKKAMITKSQEWLTQCLAIQDTNPKDCGMNTPLPSGKSLAPGTLTRVVVTDAPFSTATPRVAYDDPKKITMSSYVLVKLTASDTTGVAHSGSTSVTTAVGTINGETITVVFTD